MNKKAQLLVLGSLALALSSCMKSKTCTCTDSSGKVVSEVTKKSTSKSALADFEESCKKSSVSGSSGNTSCTIK